MTCAPRTPGKPRGLRDADPLHVLRPPARHPRPHHLHHHQGHHRVGHQGGQRGHHVGHQQDHHGLGHGVDYGLGHGLGQSIYALTPQHCDKAADNKCLFSTRVGAVQEHVTVQSRATILGTFESVQGTKRHLQDSFPGSLGLFCNQETSMWQNRSCMPFWTLLGAVLQFAGIKN